MVVQERTHASLRPASVLYRSMLPAPCNPVPQLVRPGLTHRVPLQQSSPPGGWTCTKNVLPPLGVHISTPSSSEGRSAFSPAQRLQEEGPRAIKKTP